MSSPETAFEAQRSDRPLKGSAGGPGARLRDRFPETRARRRRARFAILLPPPVRARPSLPKRPPPLASRSSRGALVGLPSFAMRSLAACAIARPAGAAGRPARAPSAAARSRAPAASSGDAWRGPRGYHARGSARDARAFLFSRRRVIRGARRRGRRRRRRHRRERRALGEAPRSRDSGDDRADLRGGSRGGGSPRRRRRLRSVFPRPHPPHRRWIWRPSFAASSRST